MLVFIVPLKSPALTNSWEYLSRIFERTIRSIFQQTVDDFRVIVVCHKKPDINFDDPRLTYVEVDFPIPANDRESKRDDKRVKTRVGLFYSKAYNPSHTMVVNADDCISNRIVEFVSQNQKSDGWLLRKGYFYNEKIDLLYYDRFNFHQWCGTSNIIKYGLFKNPEKPDYDYLIKLQTLKKTYYHSHKRASEELAALGKYPKLKSLPFAGAVYIIEHGENIGYITRDMFMHKSLLSQFKKEAFNYKKMTPGLRESFGVYDLSEKTEKIEKIEY